MCQRRRLDKALQHQALLADVKAIYDSTVGNEQSPLPPSTSPPSPPPPSPLASTLPTQAITVAPPVSRRLTLVTTLAEAANIMLDPICCLNQPSSIQHRPPSTVSSSGCSSTRCIFHRRPPHIHHIQGLLRLRSRMITSRRQTRGSAQTTMARVLLSLRRSRLILSASAIDFIRVYL
jgi:hypothetical protein